MPNYIVRGDGITRTVRFKVAAVTECIIALPQDRTVPVAASALAEVAGSK